MTVRKTKARAKKRSKPKQGERKKETPAKKDDRDTLVLRLYITGSTPQSTKALINLKRICEKYLDGHYDLEVIDVYQKPHLAREHKIIAAPTLIKMLPEPLRRLIGDMSDESRVLVGLSIQPDQELKR